MKVSCQLFVCACVCMRVLEFVNACVSLSLCVKINKAIRGLSVCAPHCGVTTTDCTSRLIHNLSIFYWVSHMSWMWNSFLWKVVCAGVMFSSFLFYFYLPIPGCKTVWVSVYSASTKSANKLGFLLLISTVLHLKLLLLFSWFEVIFFSMLG